MHRYLLLLTLFTHNLCAAQARDTLAAASSRYVAPDLLQRIFIGGNYRRTWSQPVRLPVFELKKEKGGFSIKELGGGMQTKSLHLEDSSGQEWALRSVDKDVSKALESEGRKGKLVRFLSQDMISAAHPYGTLITPPLAEALGILHTAPEVFFVPDDPAFGEFRPVFANTVCLLEQRAPVHHSGDKTLSTKKMYRRLRDGDSLAARELLLARLLDMLISDWDRHGDQWKWEVEKRKGPELIHPIPRDHDQALFHSNGLLIKVVRLFTLRHIIGFRKLSVRLKQLNRKEWYFDHGLLADMPEQDWRAAIGFFQSALTDEVLQAAVHRLPAEILAYQEEWLFRRLQGRRNTMMSGAMRYYRFLQTKKAAAAIDEREAKMKRLAEKEE